MKICFYLTDIYFRHFTQNDIFQSDIAYFHYLVGLVIEGHGNIIIAIEFLAYDSRTKSVAVQTDHQIEHGRTVVCLDCALIVGCTEQLLGKIEGAVVALLKGKAGIVCKLLKGLRELGFLKGRVGQTILSAAIIDDVIGIIVLTFVLGMKDPASDPMLTIGKTVLFLVVSVVGGYIIYRIMKVVDARYPHTRRIPIIGFGLCFIMAYVAEKYFGIADITGAYVAGIVLCNIRDAEYIDRKVNVNSYMMFAPVFFVAIGLKTDFSAIDTSKIVFAVGFVIVAMITKIIGCGAVAKICKFQWIDCLKIGVGMMTRGEVALIITNKGLNMGIIDSSYFTAVILLIIISSISVPILLKMLYAKAPDPA